MRAKWVAVFMLLLVSRLPADDSPATVAARKRQEAIRSVEFLFRIQETVEPGAYAGMSGGREDRNARFPVSRFTCESANRLVIDGDRVRFEDNHPVPNLSQKAWGTARQVTVSDGKRSREFFGPTEGADRNNAYGIIGTSEETEAAVLPHYVPFHLACRGVKNTIARGMYVFPKFTPTGVRQRVKGVMVEEYQREEVAATLLIDPAQDYVARRIRKENKATGKPRVVVDVTHELHPSGIQLPKTWTATYFADSGKVERTYVVSVTQIRLNETHADELFDLRFPPGVEVDDHTDNRTYLVRNDGTFADLSTIRSSGDIRDQLHSTWWSRNWWWMAAVAVVLLLVLGVVVKRRAVRRVAPPSDASSGMGS